MTQTTFQPPACDTRVHPGDTSCEYVRISLYWQLIDGIRARSLERVDQALYEGEFLDILNINDGFPSLLYMAATQSTPEIVQRLRERGARWEMLPPVMRADVVFIGTRNRAPWLRDAVRAFIPETPAEAACSAADRRPAR